MKIACRNIAVRKNRDLAKGEKPIIFPKKISGIIINDDCGTIKIPDILQKTREYKVSVTEYLYAYHIFTANQAKRRETKKVVADKNKRFCRPAQVYDAKTLRNFSFIIY
jgi:hypothetical protein